MPAKYGTSARHVGEVMYTYEVFFSVNNQYSKVRINAASAGAAANLIRAQYHGCTVNISWITEIR
jgi:hypothetical protein